MSGNKTWSAGDFGDNFRADSLAFALSPAAGTPRAELRFASHTAYVTDTGAKKTRADQDRYEILVKDFDDREAPIFDGYSFATANDEEELRDILARVAGFGG